MTLRLPTAAGVPLPSPDLHVFVAAESPQRVVLRPWVLPTVAFEASEAIDLLLARVLADRSVGDVAARSAAATDVVFSASVRALEDTAVLAFDLVVRGRFLPGVEHDLAGDIVSQWLPVPGSADLERLGVLVRSLPPVLRAGLSGGTDASAPAVVARVLSDLVDGLARRGAAGISVAARPSKSPTRIRRPRDAATDGWLAGLASPRPPVLADVPPQLLARLAAWHRSAAVEARGSRACFQLVEPPDDSGSWHLAVLLQSAIDPSLRVPAADVWSGRGAASAIPRSLGDPRDQLLAELGRASRLYPPLVEALDDSHPIGLDLDTAGAHAFLRDAAPLLTEAGFGVLLPGWWRSGRRRLGVRARARSKGHAGSASAAGLGLESLVQIEWEVALGEATLSSEQLRQLAAAKAPLVRVRGEWVELRPDEIEAAMQLLDSRSGRDAPETMPALDVLRLAAGLEAAPSGLPVEGVTADGWLEALLPTGDDRRSRARRPRHEPTPEGFAGTLRPYQLRGLGWLESLSHQGLGACLADDMGLGKTAQLIALLLAEREQAGAALTDTTAATPRPTLVVCPMSVVGNWQRELARFGPGLRVHVHHGPGRVAEDLAAVASSADVVLTTYALVHRDRDVLAAIEWGRVVLDEAQAIKNSASRQTQAVRSLRARSRVALTGTPVENRLTELWSIMEFLNPGLLGSATTFRHRFAIPIERYRDADAAAVLRRATAPFILRRLKSDRSIIRDLPDKIETQVDCRLTREQASLYQAVVDEMLERIESSEGIERRGLVLTTMLRLKQVCNHPAHLLGDGSAMPGRSGKFARLDELLEEVLAEGDRALLFTQFAEFGEMLRSYLRDRFRRDVLYLHGGTGRSERDSMVARFESAEGPSLFVLSLKAGGTGLNLTAANHVFHVDRWWNPAVEDQATDRAYRIGQRQTVQVHKFVCTGTLEERIASVIASKRELARMVVGSGERWLTELSDAELRELVALGADAVGEEEGPL